MPKRFLVCLFVLFGLTAGLVNATAVNKETRTDPLNAHTRESPTHNIELPNQTNTVFSPELESELWIKTTFGEDFNQFYTQKVKNKKRQSNALKMDFDLGYLSQSTTKIDKSRNTYVEVNKTRIETLDVPDMQFADDTYQWNGANISIVKMGSDYQHYVDDEISAGQTYKEFWDGEETTELEDFIDDHLGFHDSALVRFLILLAGVLFVIFGYIFTRKLLEYMYPD